MKSQFVAAFLMLMSALTVFQCVNGLKCYECFYYDGFSEEDENIPYLRIPEHKKQLFDESCKIGNVPKSKYLQSCSNEETACMQHSVEGHLKSNNKPVQIHDRGCINPKVVNNTKIAKLDCNKWTPYADYQMRQGPGREESQFSADTRTTACVCKEDGCNSSSPRRSNFVTLGLMIIGLHLSSFAILCFRT